MLNSRRTFVEAIRRYGASHGISVEMKSDGWLIVMQRGDIRRCAFGYDIGLNSAVAHRLANDKAAAAEMLAVSGVPCIPHTLFLSPEMNEYVSKPGSWQAMLDLLKRHERGLVVNPNEGTTGASVF